MLTVEGFRQRCVKDWKHGGGSEKQKRARGEEEQEGSKGPGQVDTRILRLK